MRGKPLDEQVIVIFGASSGIGRATALAAAQQGAAVASAFNGTRAGGEVAAAEVADNGALTGVRVEIARGARSTTATVRGRAVVVVWPREISKAVTVQTERVTGS